MWVRVKGEGLVGGCVLFVLLALWAPETALTPITSINKVEGAMP